MFHKGTCEICGKTNITVNDCSDTDTREVCFDCGVGAYTKKTGNPVDPALKALFLLLDDAGVLIEEKHD